MLKKLLTRLSLCLGVGNYNPFMYRQSISDIPFTIQQLKKHSLLYPRSMLQIT